MRFNKYILIPILLIVLSIFANLFLAYYSIPKKFIGTIGIDQPTHFYDMKRWYESKKFPTTSTRFTATRIIDDEFTTPRVPGGAYYIFYTIFYKLSGENLLIAKTLNLIFNLIIIYIFIFWIYKKFGLFITGMISPLILCNGYIVLASTDFWNPNLSLIFSFLLFIFLFEYIDNHDEDNARKNIVRISSILIFPILAIIAQGHFFAFFSIIPTVIVYLIIKYKRTLKYIVYWILGVFISFLEYLPYLISEIQSNFSNLKMAFLVKDSFTKFPFPQIYAIAIFPTNEMSVFYGSKFESIVNFWMNLYPIGILGVLFLIITLILAFVSIIRGGYFIFNKNYKAVSNNEKTLIEMLMIFFMFIPITIVLNMFSGQFSKIHYMYPFFALSYTPILLFFIQKVDTIKYNNKLFYLSSFLLFINIFVLALQLHTYIKYYEKDLTAKELKNMLYALSEDAADNDISINLAYSGSHNYLYRDISMIYFPEININQVDDSTNLYIILNLAGSRSRTLESVSNYMNYMSTNSILITNNSTLYIYKYIGKENFKRP
ncbi:hypothetical protein [uncultured Brachyspira sp.]|uniref:hypothetical protein n=1 Tax=uncultured Brachyspira sp. TaxID=221953 RepID=UPI0026332095|nr:hypothetical protein [uncultured Brachyspira sp.]